MSFAEDLESGGRPDWHSDAACASSGLPPETWFPPPGDVRLTRAAKAVCATCPVFDECAEAGAKEQFGIWAGLSFRERRPKSRRRVCRCIRCGELFPAPGGARYCSRECRRGGAAAARASLGLPERRPSSARRVGGLGLPER